MSKAILYDATLCVGCKQCEEACARKNGLPYTEAIAAEEVGSDHKYTYVMAGANDTWMRRMCMHCEDPTCASVCPVAALHRTAEGPVIYDEDRCIGCRYCMMACPFGVPKYEWSKALPGIRKCTMCHDRVSQGLPTACAEICPTGATIMGERDALIAEARKRIEAEPARYVPHIFGEHEVGGTSVLLISGAPFEKFGFKPNYVEDSLPRLTYRVLSKIPDLTGLGFVFLGGVWWITRRRMQIERGELREPEETGREGGEEK